MDIPLKNSLLFPVIQSIHLVGIALLVGTIILGDLRIMGFALRRQPDLTRSTWAGLAIMFLTGPILFLSDTARYLNNPAFRFKMVFLLLAIAFHFTIHRKENKVSAILSMILWTCVVLGGRAITDFDV